MTEDSSGETLTWKEIEKSSLPSGKTSLLSNSPVFKRPFPLNRTALKLYPLSTRASHLVSALAISFVSEDKSRVTKFSNMSLTLQRPIYFINSLHVPGRRHSNNLCGNVAGQIASKNGSRKASFQILCSCAGSVFCTATDNPPGSSKRVHAGGFGMFITIPSSRA